MKNVDLNKIKSIIWAIALTILCSLLTILSASYVKNIKKNRDNNIEQTISVTKNDAFASTNESVRNLVNILQPEEVKTGIFLDRYNTPHFRDQKIRMLS